MSISLTITPQKGRNVYGFKTIWLLYEDSLLDCNFNQLGRVAQFEFFQDIRFMPFDRFIADEEFFGNLPGDHSVSQGPDYFNFARGDRLQVGPEVRFYLGKVMYNNV